MPCSLSQVCIDACCIEVSGEAVRCWIESYDMAVDGASGVCEREKRDSAELGVSRCASAAERCKVAAISLDYCKPAASAVYVDCQSGMLCWIIP